MPAAIRRSSSSESAAMLSLAVQRDLARIVHVGSASPLQRPDFKSPVSLRPEPSLSLITPLFSVPQCTVRLPRGKSPVDVDGTSTVNVHACPRNHLHLT